MLDSYFRFNGGDSDFGFDASALSSDDEEVVNSSSSNEDVLVKAQITEICPSRRVGHFKAPC